jgi:ribosome maturation factor RimP
LSPHFLGMAEIIEKIHAFIETLLDGTDVFIVDIKIKPTNNIKVFLDADDGFSIEKCVAVNRKLYHLIEESGMFPDGDFSLEVSSPGIDEPLMQRRQYKKNVGRKVAVTTADDKETIGMLTAVTDEGLTLEVKAPRAKEAVVVEIPFENIKKTIVQIIF